MPIEEHRSAKILIVEDDRLIQLFVPKIIQSLGYDVEIAMDGKTAINRYADGSYDLVLLDIGLPDISGDLVCRTLREQHNATIPIIGHSALGNACIERCISSGMNEVLIKPVRVEQYKTCFEKYLGKIID